MGRAGPATYSYFLFVFLFQFGFGLGFWFKFEFEVEVELKIELDFWQRKANIKGPNKRKQANKISFSSFVARQQFE